MYMYIGYVRGSLAVIYVVIFLVKSEHKRSPGNDFADDMKTNIRVIFIYTVSNFESNSGKRFKYSKL